MQKDLEEIYMSVQSIGVASSSFFDVGAYSAQKKTASLATAGRGSQDTLAISAGAWAMFVETQGGLAGIEEQSIQASSASEAMKEEFAMFAPLAHTSSSEKFASPLESTNSSNESQSMAEEVLEKITSGMSFEEALFEVKAEKYEAYFKEELEKNGGDAHSAAARAQTRLESESYVSEEDMLAIVQDLATTYGAVQSSEAQHIADVLDAYAETLETSLQGVQAAQEYVVNKDEKKALQNELLHSLFAQTSSNTQKTLEEEKATKDATTNLTVKEQLEREHGIKQYEKVARL